MRPVRALFDSNVLIRFLKEKRRSVLDDLFAGGERFVISRVTWIEVRDFPPGTEAVFTPAAD